MEMVLWMLNKNVSTFKMEFWKKLLSIQIVFF